MPHIVFFGINGVGLGHIARLSVIQRYLAKHHPQYHTEALCRSTMGDSFFTCSVTSVPKGRDLAKALKIRGVAGFVNLLLSRYIPSRRKTIVFDTWWSRSVIKKLKFGGHRTILVMQSFKPDDMYDILRRAPECFEHIFFPCQPEEIEYHYKSHPALWALLQDAKFKAVGPFVRPSNTSDDGEKVIFTLGGGGEKEDEDPRYSIRGYIEQYKEAARILHEAGKSNLYLAKGPLMEVDMDLGHLQVLETMKLPNHFGPNTTVVTRGTYNLTWEAIAAGAKLVTTTRSAVLPEFSDSRNAYLEQRGYGYQSEMTGAALAEAILQDRPAHLDEATALVNARPGLARIAEALCQDTNKNSSPETVYFGINGVGVGHIARLSVVQRYIEVQYPDSTAKALCRSTMGASFFTCACTNVPKGRDLAKALDIRGIKGFINLLQARLNPSKRKTVVFDTWWSRSVVKKLKFGKHRTVAIVESFKPDDMLRMLKKGEGCIDHIFFPCQPEEIEYHYKDHPELWALLQEKKFEAVGPFVRPADGYDDEEKVIFTLGGGGENKDEDPRYSIRGYVEQYVEAARILHEAGKTNLYLAKGPLMDLDMDLGHLEILETMQLPNHFGPNTTVIARGTYNLTWEAIAAGAKLVATTRSAVLPEFSDSRNAYLEQRGYAYQSEMTGAALAEAILRDRPAQLSEATALVNARPGLARIAQVVRGETNE